MQLFANEDEKLRLWLQRINDKCCSGDIQNIVLKLMARHVVNEIISALQTAPFFSLMVDETTDISNTEQVVFFCFRWVDQFLNAHEEFVGLYCVGSTEASVIFSVIKDVMTRMNISFKKLWGQYYDGAASMSGI